MKWQNIPVAFPLFKHFIKLEIEPLRFAVIKNAATPTKITPNIFNSLKQNRKIYGN